MKLITAGKKGQCATVVSDAARKATEAAISDLEKNGVLNNDNLQQIIEKGDHVSSEVKKFLKTLFAQMAESIMGCLKLISGAETLALDPTDGKELIGKSTDIFRGMIDHGFKDNGCNVMGEPTGTTNVQVYEMVKDGDFSKIYSGLGDDLDSLCLTQSQIVHFVVKYPHWLRTEGYGTWFLFKANCEYFVANVSAGSTGLDARIHCFSYGSIWRANLHPRFVVPQLTQGT